MNVLPKALIRVIESFQRLPGIGPKSAQRLSFYLLHLPEEELTKFSEAVRDLKKGILLCSVCKNVTESDPCPICSSPNRDGSILCVVEQPTDVLSLERTGVYQGFYHVLHGVIDPLNNIGPDELFIADLLKRIKNETHPIAEIIFALNPTMEGEATTMYIQKQIEQGRTASGKKQISMTKLAHGLPVGADIEYADEVTLKRALEGRRTY